MKIGEIGSSSKEMDRRSTSYILPYWHDMRGTAHMNELGDIPNRKRKW